MYILHFSITLRNSKKVYTFNKQNRKKKYLFLSFLQELILGCIDIFCGRGEGRDEATLNGSQADDHHWAYAKLPILCPALHWGNRGWEYLQRGPHPVVCQKPRDSPWPATRVGKLYEHVHCPCRLWESRIYRYPAGKFSMQTPHQSAGTSVQCEIPQWTLDLRPKT